MKATTVRQRELKKVQDASKQELLQRKREQLHETFKKVDPEQLRKFFNREI